MRITKRLVKCVHLLGKFVCRFKENAILFFINDPMTVMLANKQIPHNAFDAVYNIITFCVIRSLEYQV